MATRTEIPVIDLAQYGRGVADKQTTQTLADKMCEAFSNIGFCYITNHGIRQSMVDDVTTTSMKFFEMSDDRKEPFARPDSNDQFHGWIALERERLSPDRPNDYKEAYNYIPGENSENWPDVPGFESSMKQLFASCQDLALRIFDLISMGLKLEDKDFLRKCHTCMGGKGSSTCVRSLYYPPIPESRDIKPNQLRCSEHSDYGTLTLLFQDSIGGLEVRNVEGEYIPATPIPGSILINLGDLMQRWTADKLLATKHRVLFPNDTAKMQQARHSIACFIQPDNDVVIKCLDGSEKYKPMTSLEYLMERFAATY